MFRKDRIKNLKTTIKKLPINKKLGWCDDPRSIKYNKLINYPFKLGSEKLYRKDNIYDLILVLNFNMNPIKINKGSAIFIHVANKKFRPTKGCIALKKSKLIEIIKYVKKNSIVKII